MVWTDQKLAQAVRMASRIFMDVVGWVEVDGDDGKLLFKFASLSFTNYFGSVAALQFNIKMKYFLKNINRRLILGESLNMDLTKAPEGSSQAHSRRLLSSIFQKIMGFQAPF